MGLIEEKKHQQEENNFVFRLHLVRHGETEANRAEIVLGQIDSPLTNLGIQQARAAHRSFGNYKNFFKIYSSDLVRCIRTSNLIFGLEDSGSHGHEALRDDKNEPIYILDKRLRERAKGVREGRSKHLTYDEAMELYKKEQIEGKRVDEEIESQTPLLENEEQVLERVQDWLQENIRIAHLHFQSSNAEDGVYDVLAISHSGTLRILIEKLVGKQLPPNAQREKVGNEGDARKDRLGIPNTSKTVIEFRPFSDDVKMISSSHGLQPFQREIKGLSVSSHFSKSIESTDRQKILQSREIGEIMYDITSSHSAKLVDFVNVSHFKFIS
jgi:broad specificity phosphatase PhoE